MHLFTSKTSRLIPGLAALALLLTGHASQAADGQSDRGAGPPAPPCPTDKTCSNVGLSPVPTRAATARLARLPTRRCRPQGTGWSPIVITVPWRGHRHGLDHQPHRSI